MAALTMGLAMTGAMMTSCSNQDNPTVGPDEGVLPGGQTIVLSELESDYVAQDGDITITGGTVIATGEGLGTGIGCGGCANFPSVCGDITIESGVGFVNVTAIKGVSAYKPIGFSLIDEGCVCGDIYFNDNLINSMKYWYDPKEDNYGGLIITISSSEPGNPKKESGTWTLTPAE